MQRRNDIEWKRIECCLGGGGGGGCEVLMLVVEFWRGSFSHVN